MLLSTILGEPPPKLILIQDTLETKQNSLVETIISLNHEKSIHIFSYENQIKVSSNSNRPNFITLYDLNATHKDFTSLENKVMKDEICIFDSLSDMVYIYGINQTLGILRRLIDKTRQIIIVLHLDLFEDDKLSILFQHISNVIIDLHSKNELEYIYKRVNGKASKHNEEIRIENGIFTTVPIKIEVKKIDEEPSILPDQLTSFKISLNEKEIESRKKLVLPFMQVQENQGKPKVSLNEDKNQAQTPQSRVLYIPDENDDIDEEDPDDDLDI